MNGSDDRSNKAASSEGGPWANAAPRVREEKQDSAAEEGSHLPPRPDSERPAPSSPGASKPWATRSHPSPSSAGRPNPGGPNPSGPNPSEGESPAASRPPAVAGDVGRLASHLISEVEARVNRHPSGALVRARRETVPITLEVPIRRGKDRLAAFTTELGSAMDAAVLSLVSEREVAESGRAFCLRCSSASCEHGAPAPKQVFTGYGPSGLPQFEDYSQAMLDLGDDGMPELFGASGRVVSRLWTELELSQHLLPAFQESENGYRVLGQVTAGWYWLPSSWEDEARAKGHSRKFALSFQIALIDVPGQPRRLALNTIGTSPTEEPLESLHDAFGEVPWEEARRWCRLALGDVERSLRRLPPSKAKAVVIPKGEVADAEQVWHQRTLKILAGFERRLMRRERAKGRKTQHAESRRKEKRPTGHALADLAAAPDSAVMKDTRKGTFVVLGDRGRTHIFNGTGRLVTSIVYGTDAIEKRMTKGFWVGADGGEIGHLRKVVAAAGVAAIGGVSQE